MKMCDQLYAWSIDEMEAFWTALWDECGVIAETRGPRVLVDGDKMPGARFFPDGRRDTADAIVFWGEDRVKRRLSFRALHEQVSR